MFSDKHGMFVGELPQTVELSDEICYTKNVFP